MPDDIKTVLLTVGRLPVALELARQFHADGWRVLVAEPMRWHVARLCNCVSRCFTVESPVQDQRVWEDQLLRIIDQEMVSLVVPISEETLFVAGLKERLEPSVIVLSMHQDIVLSLHDKWRFAHRARLLGLPVPETALSDDDRALALMSRQAVVRKPRFGCAGVGVSRHTQGSTLETDKRQASHLVQRCVDGAACCSFAIAVHGQVQLTVVYRPQTEAGSVAVCFEAVEAPAAVARVIESIVADTHYSGMIAFDHLWSDEHGWQVIECNPRATSGLHLLDSNATYVALIKAMNHLSGQASIQASSNCCSEVPEAPSTESHEVLGEKARDTLEPTGTRAQEFWSHLAELQGRLLRGRFQLANWKCLFSTRDICWSWQDLKPALLFVPVNVSLLLRAWRAGVAVPQIVMQDVSWQPTSDDVFRRDGSSTVDDRAS